MCTKIWLKIHQSVITAYLEGDESPAGRNITMQQMRSVYFVPVTMAMVGGVSSFFSIKFEPPVVRMAHSITQSGLETYRLAWFLEQRNKQFYRGGAKAATHGSGSESLKKRP